MNVRAIAMIAVVAVTCWLSINLSEHHEGDNSKAFEFLYGHVVPAPLVWGGHDAHDHAAHGQSHEHAAGETADHADDHGPHPVENALLPIPFLWPVDAMDGDRDPSNGHHLVLTNLQLFQLAALLLIFIAFSGVSHYLKTGEGDRITRLLSGFCMYVREEMAVKVMGKDADRFMPLFFSLFFFILFMNIMGLAPGSATPTASIFVTAALALVTLGAMIGCGMAEQGAVAFWKNLVPHVPWWLWPLMFVVEVLGLFVKPFALMIRLFANLTGGHMVVLSFMGLIFFFAGTDFNALMGYGVAPVAIGFAVFIMIIEAFVAMVQAFIFTQLTIIFVGAAIHPEH